MDEADFKNAVAIVKTGAEAGVPFGEIEGHRLRGAASDH